MALMGHIIRPKRVWRQGEAVSVHALARSVAWLQADKDAQQAVVVMATPELGPGSYLVRYWDGRMDVVHESRFGEPGE